MPTGSSKKTSKARRVTTKADVQAVFAARLLDARKARKLTQAEAAQRCDMPHITWRSYETKGIAPTHVGLYKIARGLGISVDWLLGLSDHCSRVSPGDQK